MLSPLLAFVLPAEGDVAGPVFGGLVSCFSSGLRTMPLNSLALTVSVTLLEEACPEVPSPAPILITWMVADFSGQPWYAHTTVLGALLPFRVSGSVDSKGKFYFVFVPY